MNSSITAGLVEGCISHWKLEKLQDLFHPKEIIKQMEFLNIGKY